MDITTFISACVSRGHPILPIHRRRLGIMRHVGKNSRGQRNYQQQRLSSRAVNNIDCLNAWLGEQEIPRLPGSSAGNYSELGRCVVCV